MPTASSSREWNSQGIQRFPLSNPTAHVRRCGRCEAYDAIRVAQGLGAFGLPGHHENEHYDNSELYGKNQLTFADAPDSMVLDIDSQLPLDADGEIWEEA